MAQQKPSDLIAGPLSTLVSMWRDRAERLRRESQTVEAPSENRAAVLARSQAYANAANELENRLKHSEG